MKIVKWYGNSGISLCFVGTPDSAIFFEKEQMLARRSLGLNYTAMSYDDEFQSFCKAILKYCYVQDPINVDESTLIWLYQHSGGNASVVVSIIHDSQEIAILDGYERLDITTLNIAYEKRMKMLHNYIQPQLLKASSPKKKKSEPSIPIENSVIDNNIIIHQIVMNAKNSQKDIVYELRKNDLKISEVAI